MLPRSIGVVRPLRRLAVQIPRASVQIRRASNDNVPDHLQNTALDPGMNGGYPDLPRVKRSERDPYDDWWDKQERRNFGEPVHEDNDVLGVFSTENYKHFTPGWGGVLMGTFIASVFGLCGVVSLYYPDRPSAPRTFPDGLERELGGPGAVPARKDE